MIATYVIYDRDMVILIGLTENNIDSLKDGNSIVADHYINKGIPEGVRIGISYRKTEEELRNLMVDYKDKIKKEIEERIL